MAKQHQKESTVLSCDDCKGTFSAVNWQPGMPCPKCNSCNVTPVVVTGGAIDYALADRSEGHAVEDMRFGQIARWAGLIDDADYQKAMAQQRRCIIEEKPVPDVASILVQRGAVSKEEAAAILETMASTHPTFADEEFARHAVFRDWIDKEKADRIQAEQKAMADKLNEVPSLAQIAFERRLLSQEQVLEILRDQQRNGVGLLVELRTRLDDAKGVSPVKGLIPRGGLTTSNLLGGMFVVVLFAAMGYIWYSNLFGQKGGVPVFCTRCHNVNRIKWSPREGFPVVCPTCGQKEAYYYVRCKRCGNLYQARSPLARNKCPRCGCTLYTEDIR